MAEYRTIRVSFWNDPFIEDLSPQDKLLYIYLFTCPHVNNLGLIEVSQKKIAFETGLAAGDIKDALMRMAEAGKVIVDGQAIWLANFIKHQSTTSPKLIQSIKRLIPSIPSATIKHEVCLRYPHIFDDCDTVSIPSRELERELELELERERENSPTPLPISPEDEAELPELENLPIEFQELVNVYPGESDIKPSLKLYEAKRKLKTFSIARITSDILAREKTRKWMDRCIPKLSTYLDQEQWRNPIRETDTAAPQEGPPPVKSWSDADLAAIGIVGKTW